MLSGINGALYLGHQLRDGAVQVAGKPVKGAAVVGLVGFDADGLEENRRRDVVRVGDERDGHPGPDRLIGCVDVPRFTAGAEGEEESAD
ncbi:MAG: hypothetical protein WBY44_19165 [Bryobacteraceae bacterium]